MATSATPRRTLCLDEPPPPASAGRRRRVPDRGLRPRHARVTAASAAAAAPQPVSQYCAPTTPTDAPSYQSAFDTLRRTYTEWATADGAVPVRLSASKTLWMFGDTFIGKVNGLGCHPDRCPARLQQRRAPDRLVLRTGARWLAAEPQRLDRRPGRAAGVLARCPRSPTRREPSVRVPAPLRPNGDAAGLRYDGHRDPHRSLQALDAAAARHLLGRPGRHVDDHALRQHGVQARRVRVHVLLERRAHQGRARAARVGRVAVDLVVLGEWRCRPRV